MLYEIENLLLDIDGRLKFRSDDVLEFAQEIFVGQVDLKSFIAIVRAYFQ